MSTLSAFSSSASAARVPRTAAIPWTYDWFFALLSLTAWAFAPFVRRFLDWKSGAFHAIDIVSVLPLITILPLAAYALSAARLRRVPQALKAFLIVWFVALGYGFVVAVVRGNTSGALYEFAQYGLPAIFGLWLAGQKLESDIATSRVVGTLLLLGFGVGLYAIAQWISPAPWDVAWIQGSGIISMGDPIPFNLRVFSTLNSTGPAADFFALIIMFTLPTLRIRSVPTLAVVLIATVSLMLTLVRASWIGVAVALLAYLITSPRRLRTLPVVGIGVLAVLLLAGSLPALLGSAFNGTAIVDRFQTLGDTEHDYSQIVRQQEYGDALDQASSLPFGLGLGAFGNAARLSGDVDVDQLGRVIDGGYIARLLSLGWGAFPLYVLVTIGMPVWLIVELIRKGKKLTSARGAIVALGVAVGTYLVWMDVAVDSHLGLSGLLFWIACALAFRSSSDAAPMEA